MKRLVLVLALTAASAAGCGEDVSACGPVVDRFFDAERRSTMARTAVAEGSAESQRELDALEAEKLALRPYLREWDCFLP